MRTHLFTLIVLLAFLAPAVHGQQKQADVIHHADLTYGDKDVLKLDIVMPAKIDAPRPAVILIHGTGPFAKQRKALLPHATEFAKQGFIAVTIDYHHLSDAPFPMALEDGESAIRWLRGNADKYKIDRTRIAAVGFSGGGALALHLGASRGDEKASSRVQAVVAYYPPTDFAQLHYESETGKVGFPSSLLVKSGLEQWLGGAPAKAADKYAQASPITHLTRDAAPMLLVHGVNDTVVPIDQSRRFVERASASKARVSFLELTGAGHGFDDEKSLNAQLADSTTRAFLTSLLMPARTEVAQK